MLSYADIRDNRRELLALTGLTAREFRQLLESFSRAYESRHPAGRTGAGVPRRRAEGGGRKAALGRPEDKLLFILTYLKTYPLQAVMARLFGMSQPGVNHWVHRLLPVLRAALADLGVAPERDPAGFARDRPAPDGGRADPRRIIDGTDRRRQRPKKPVEQAIHYSGKRKAHCDRNLVVTGPRRGPVAYLSGTYPCRAHDKAIADHEGIKYPRGTVLYKDGGFQGYEPAVAETRQAKKKAARPRADARRASVQPEAVAGAGRGGARHRRRQALPHREGRAPQHQGRRLRRRHGGRLRTAQPPRAEPPAKARKVARHG
jgi:hypothetical protein